MVVVVVVDEVVVEEVIIAGGDVVLGCSVGFSGVMIISIVCIDLFVAPPKSILLPTIVAVDCELFVAMMIWLEFFISMASTPALLPDRSITAIIRVNTSRNIHLELYRTQPLA